MYTLIHLFVILVCLASAANSLRPANKYSTLGQDSQAIDVAGVPQQNVANASSFPVLMSHHYSSRDSEAVFIMSTCTSNHRWDGVALTKAQQSIVAKAHESINGGWSYVEPTVTIQWQTSKRQVAQVCQVDRIDLLLFTIVCPKMGHEVTAKLSMYSGSERVEVWDGVHVNIDRDAAPKRKVQVCTMDGKPGTENVDRLLNHAAYYSAIGVDSVRMYYRGGWGEPGFEDYLDSHLRLPKAARIKMADELAAWIKSGKLELVRWNPSWGMTPENDAWKAPEPADGECAGDGPAYLDCLYMAKGSVDWLGVVQQDEFYHLREKPLQNLLASIPPDIEYLVYTLYEWNATFEEDAIVSNYLTAENVLRSPEIGTDVGTLWGALVRPRSAVAMGAQGATLSSAEALGRYLDPEGELVVEHFTWHPDYWHLRDIRVNTTAVYAGSVKDQAQTLSQTELSDSRSLKFQPYTAWKEEWAAKVAAVRKHVRNMYM